MTITFLNLGEKLGLFAKAANGDGAAAAKLIQEANMAPISYMLAKDTAKGSHELFNAVRSGNTAQYINTAKAGAFAQLTSGASNATCYRAFPSTTVQKFLPGFIKSMDRSLLETGVGRGILAKLGGSAAITRTATGATARVTGGAAAQVGGKALARIPIIGIVISSLFEIPDIVDAFKNGDGMTQLGRSTVNVAATTIGAAIGGALGSLIPIPGLGTVLGSAVGGWLGNKVGKFFGNLLFGKSIKDKMRDGDYGKQIMKSYSNINFGNIGTGYSIYGDKLSGYKASGSQNVNANTTLAYVNEGLARFGNV